MNDDEPFVREVSKEFDRYMDIINTLEKKSQNLIVVSSTFIAILIGVIFIRSEKLPVDQYYILIPVIILLAVIITSILAVRVHGQIMPININGFFISRGIDNKKHGIDNRYLSAALLRTENTSNMDDKTKKDYELNVEEKYIALQKWLAEHYLNAMFSATKNGIRIAKYVKISEKLFMGSIISGIIIAVLLITKIIT